MRPLAASAAPASPSLSPVSSTAAQAMPSGYGSSLDSVMNTLRMGIISRIPSRPPVKATPVTVQKSNSVQVPITMSAGIVKMMPAARLSPADAQVWTWFASRMERSRNTYRKTSIAMTAAGIDADTVIPTLSPT